MTEKAPEEGADLTPEEVRAIYESAQQDDTPDWQDETVN
jgi:hypothetical protein